MTECEHCKLAEKGEKVFESKNIVAVMSDKPAALGHVVVLPKEHYTIMEQVPDFIIAEMMNAANKLSTSLFEMMKIEGTNIIVSNGTASGQNVPHFSMSIIPRSSNDGLGFVWQPKSMDEEKMSTIRLQIEHEAKNIGEFKKEEKKPEEAPKPEEITDEEDYMAKQLERIP